MLWSSEWAAAREKHHRTSPITIAVVPAFVDAAELGHGIQWRWRQENMFSMSFPDQVLAELDGDGCEPFLAVVANSEMETAMPFRPRPISIRPLSSFIRSM